MEVKMEIRREWRGGHWWIIFPRITFARGMAPHVKGGPETSSLWLRYDDLCEAFPGFQEIYTPEPDEPKE